MRPAALRAVQADQKQGNFPYERKSPPGWVLDLLVEAKLSGEPIGAKRKRSVKCERCWTMKSLNGSCYCN